MTTEMPDPYRSVDVPQAASTGSAGEVFIAALEAVRLGYDVRLLADLSVARRDTDRSLVLDRLALHGVLMTTVRQALLEWAVCLDDPDCKQKVIGLLS